MCGQATSTTGRRLTRCGRRLADLRAVYDLLLTKTLQIHALPILRSSSLSQKIECGFALGLSCVQDGRLACKDLKLCLLLFSLLSLCVPQHACQWRQLPDHARWL